MYLDCSTKDIQRLESRINALSKEFAETQVKYLQGLDVRDSVIVTYASLELLQIAAKKAAKKSTTPRFFRTVGVALRVARSFGTGRSISSVG